MALMIDPDNTILIQVPDNDLAGENIFSDDLALIDVSFTFRPYSGSKLYCVINDEEFFRKLIIKDNKKLLITSNNKIPTYEIKETDKIEAGIVNYTITSHIPVHLYGNGKGNNTVDLNKLLVKNRAHTFLGLIEGDSMKNARVLHGDLAIIDKSLNYLSGNIALCRIEDKYTLKYLQWDKKDKSILWLMPANDDYKPIKVIKGDKRVEVWGVVAHTITPHIIKFGGY